MYWRGNGIFPYVDEWFFNFFELLLHLWLLSNKVLCLKCKKQIVTSTLKLDAEFQIKNRHTNNSLKELKEKKSDKCCRFLSLGIKGKGVQYGTVYLNV